MALPPFPHLQAPWIHQTLLVTQCLTASEIAQRTNLCKSWCYRRSLLIEAAMSGVIFSCMYWQASVGARTVSVLGDGFLCNQYPLLSALADKQAVLHT